MKSFVSALNTTDKVLTLVIKWLTIAAFIGLTLILTGKIIVRYIPFTSLHWADEIVELLTAAMVFYGAAGVWMIKGHFSVGNWIAKIVKSEHGQNLYKLLLEIISLAFVAILFYYSLKLVIQSRESTSVFQISKKVLYSCAPASALIMVAYSLVYVVRTAVGVFNPLSPLAMGAKPKEASQSKEAQPK